MYDMKKLWHRSSTFFIYEVGKVEMENQFWYRYEQKNTGILFFYFFLRQKKNYHSESTYDISNLVTIISLDRVIHTYVRTYHGNTL